MTRMWGKNGNDESVGEGKKGRVHKIRGRCQEKKYGIESRGKENMET